MALPILTKPYWYQLLDYWVNTGDNSGLSLPFLIGARTVFEAGFLPEEHCIRQLLSAVVNSERWEYCATLSYCGTIQAYILGLQARDDLVAPFFINAAGTPTLAILGAAFSREETLDGIISFLEKQYIPLILAGEYSRRNSAFGTWGAFDQDDLQLIRKALIESPKI